MSSLPQAKNVKNSNVILSAEVTELRKKVSKHFDPSVSFRCWAPFQLPFVTK